MPGTRPPRFSDLHGLCPRKVVSVALSGLKAHQGVTTMTLFVEKQEDWQSIAAIGGPVVDPMILRCGEVFLRGSANSYDQSSAWDLLSKNIHALGTFFDRLILEKQIPVFDYSATFDVDMPFEGRTLAAINEDEEVLVNVNVRFEAYMDAKNAALAELTKFYKGGVAGVSGQQAHEILRDLASIVGELTTSGYAWYPNLGDLTFENPDEQRLAAYILGGLIFGAYAQLAGTDHLMQPKRSRLFLALTLKQNTARGAEDYLFTKLGELSGRPTADIPYTPHLFSTPAKREQYSGRTVEERDEVSQKPRGPRLSRLAQRGTGRLQAQRTYRYRTLSRSGANRSLHSRQARRHSLSAG